MSKLLFLGDFFYDYKIIMPDIEEISCWIKKNNFMTILNLEAPLCQSDSKIIKRGPNLFQSEVTIQVLKKLNVVAVCLANNHIMDYGEEALFRTINILNENGILHVGAGKNLSEALLPIKLEIEDRTLYLQNFAWNIEEAINATANSSGCAPRNNSIITSNTRMLRENNPDSIIINVYHWGFEYNLYPMPFDRELAYQSIDAGCNLIIGHHSHNIQSYEEYKNKKIFYSLGNFYFGSRRSRFQNKIFDYRINNMCDYGAMVIYDLISMKIDVEYLEYNFDTGKSQIVIDKKLPVLMDDITNCNYLSKEYYKLAKKGSININPILRVSKFSNFFKINRLNLFYFAYRLYSNLKSVFRKRNGGKNQ